MSTLLTNFFRLGKLPDEALQLLGDEQILYRAESVFAWLTLRDFNYRGRFYAHFKRTGFYGSFVISDQRVLAYRGARRQLHVPFADPRFDELQFDAVSDEKLSIKAMANCFRSEATGSVEFRFPVPEAAKVKELIRLHREIARLG